MWLYRQSSDHEKGEPVVTKTELWSSKLQVRGYISRGCHGNCEDVVAKVELLSSSKLRVCGYRSSVVVMEEKASMWLQK